VFNYAEALNQGLSAVTTDVVLVISAHTELANTDAVEYALALMAEDESLGAAYFCHENGDTLGHERIDGTRFDGFNGLWNTCAMIRMQFLQERKFNPEVFTAEDQEWAKWLFYERKKAVARISGAGLLISNQRPNRQEKRLNEYVSVAYFANRRLLGWGNLVRIAWRAIRPLHLGRPGERQFWLILMWRLLLCRFVKPRYQSRYF
jgi:hypothetical protein